MEALSLSNLDLVLLLDGCAVPSSSSGVSCVGTFLHVGLICPSGEHLTIDHLGNIFRAHLTKSFETPDFHIQPFTTNLWSKASRELGSRAESSCHFDPDKSYLLLSIQGA